MTHDHAEDFALCDAALRCRHLASIGLIGSAAKWARFRRACWSEGHDEAAIVTDHAARSASAELAGKEPATIAVSVAVDLLRVFAADRARDGG